MKLFAKLFLFLSLCISFNQYCMERDTVFFSPSTHRSDDTISMAIYQLQEDRLNGHIEHIGVINPFFTHQELAVEIVKSCNKGASVKAVVDNESLESDRRYVTNKAQEVKELLTNNGVEFYSPYNQHIKVLYWRSKKGDEKFYRVISGSANFSENAKNNNEHMVFQVNNKKLYTQYKKLINAGGLYFEEDRAVVDMITDQENNSFISTIDHDLIASICETLEHTQVKNRIYASSYTYDSHDLTDALCKARRRGVQVELLLDKINKCKPKNSDVFNQLKSLSDVGVDLNYVSQFPDAVYEAQAMHHTKYILLEDTEDKANNVVIEGSANFTQDANCRLNQLTVHKENPEFFAKFKSYHKKMTPINPVVKQQFKNISEFVINKKRSMDAADFSDTKNDSKKRRIIQVS